MKTEDLIAALALDAPPASPASLQRRLMMWSLPAAATAFLGVWFYLHLRPDLMQAMGGVTFWMKAGYTAALAAAGGWLFTRLGRPGASATAPLLVLLSVLAVALAMGAMNMMAAPSDGRMPVLLGHSYQVCAINIAGLSLLTAPFLFWAARKFAPTRPMRAGAAAGLTAGAIAATLYGLHCQESTAAFVATWYSLGILISTAAGAVIGRFALRW
jgi:hypothetical protein